MHSRFDIDVNRRNTGCMKWDVAENELPMWVADMDFQTAPAVIDALKARVEHGVFGYTLITDEWYEAYQGWWKKRHSFELEKDWLIFCTGVVPAISSIVRKVTTVAENVLVMTPVYNIFFNSIYNNGRNILESRLKLENGEYLIDFADLEEKLALAQTTLLILCNPHNPVGKIWDKETLVRIGELCEKHHVIVLSDEIHCDLTKPGKDYVPFASASETCRSISITCVAPTKAFNIAGLQTAAVIVPNPVLRHKVNRGLNTDEVAEPNVFAAIAPVAAFNNGGEWLDELKAYLWENRLYAEAYIRENIPLLRVIEGEATYLLWIDGRQAAKQLDELKNSAADSKAAKAARSTPDFCEYIRAYSGLYLSDGKEYHGLEGFLRMNLACKRDTLEEGLERLKKSIDALS